MDHAAIIGILLAYTLAREAFFILSTQKLVNKLMSRDFYEYQGAVARAKAKPQGRPLKEDTDMPEDLGVLQGIV